MHISVHSVNLPLNGPEVNYKPFNFYFSTQINLTRINPYNTTFQDLLAVLYPGIEHHLYGNNQYLFQVHQIAYWALIGNCCCLYKIKLPSKKLFEQLPPLALMNGTYRVHFCTTHTAILNKNAT